MDGREERRELEGRTAMGNARERDSDRGIREIEETDLGKESGYRACALGKKDRKWRGNGKSRCELKGTPMAALSY